MSTQTAAAAKGESMKGQLVDRADEAPAAEAPGNAGEHEGIVHLEGEDAYLIGRFDTLPPFLMPLVTDTDLWMYVSSHGAVTAGRVDVDHCLFPFVTDDQLHLFAGRSGPITVLRVSRPGEPAEVWRPFGSF